MAEEEKFLFSEHTTVDLIKRHKLNINTFQRREVENQFIS
jgi:hypothetical protein